MSGDRSYDLRAKLGVVLCDLPRYLPCLVRPGGWVDVCNRRDRLAHGPGGLGACCEGRWSSDLHACHVFPWLGRALMTTALREWPIRFGPRLRSSDVPEISFVITHRGADRIPPLLATVRSIAAQRDAAIECIIVEQSADSTVREWPRGVRYIHLPHPSDPVGWHKSWAFNVGVDAAKAPIVVCHDGDILVPCDYARQVLRCMDEPACEVAHLQRFLFCLNPSDTAGVTASATIPRSPSPERVRQNWQGGTLAIRKDAFFRIGGYDERFVGWGGEDNEFYDRCTTLPGRRHGYLPFVHLSHASQSEKHTPVGEPNMALLGERLGIPPEQRIAEMTKQRAATAAEGDSSHWRVSRERSG